MYDEYGEHLFNKNIRRHLKTNINKEVEKSLEDNPEMFWYKNNGLSIICDSANPNTAGGKNSITLTNPYIVNGGQTTRTIAHLYKKISEEKRDEIFTDAKVIVRIYQTTDPDIIFEIAKGTNTQNPVSSFDLKSLNPKLKKIGKFFEGKNISLIIQQGNTPNKEKKDKEIKADTLLQAYCSIHKGIPEQARNNKQKLINEYYDTVYNQEGIEEDLLKSFELYDKMKQYKKNIDSEHHLKYSEFAMLFCASKLDGNLEKADSLISKIIQEKIAKDSNFSLPNYLKTKQSTDRITEEIKKISNEK
ncbi:MAG: AIPR family protein [Alphaproteobacteria bacterium]|jgi:hypothetical protein|nr:AIPR family protein [Alphaproteobacteria bacterium]